MRFWNASSSTSAASSSSSFCDAAVEREHDAAAVSPAQPWSLTAPLRPALIELTGYRRLLISEKFDLFYTKQPFW
ncbi:MAG: hypothetical protein CMQ21_17635 [Gammaproteobacteria bacterium]|nr:hypothetical protein [Gammaproteobacteria bacterium]